MLMMKCPSCDKYIVSALLAEIERVSCEHCSAEVPVENVLVSANGFTLDREDLFKRFYRYKKLVSEVAEEKAQLDNSGTSSEESRKSIDKFLSTLLEVMAGARDNFRFQFSPALPVKIKFNNRDFSGWLRNLSMEGACLELLGADANPRTDISVGIEFSLPNQSAPLTISATTLWSIKDKRDDKPVSSLGLKFLPPDDTTRIKLWEFICDAAEEANIKEREKVD